MVSDDLNPVDQQIDYVRELAAVMAAEGFTIPGKNLNDPDIAKAIYDMHIWCQDPVNNLLGRIGGLIFLKSDSVMCRENRVSLKDGWPGTPVELSADEKHEIRRYKEDIEVLEKCREMITQLSSNPTTPKEGE